MYFSHIEETDNTDMITLEELDHTHPRGIITLYNGFDPVTKVDYELSSYNSSSLMDLITHGKHFNPGTREPFDDNQLFRIKWYAGGITMFPDIKHTDIADYKSIIYRWLQSPLEENVNTHMARYFVTYDQIIDYFNFKELNTREKAELYLNSKPDKTWVIRKSSISDTKYNQFFVIMVKKTFGFDNYLFVHRQGYGVVGADAYRHSDISTVTLLKSEYYTNIVDLLIAKCKKGIIAL
jgi:hypothetical protein